MRPSVFALAALSAALRAQAADTLVPGDWAGRWAWTLTHRDRETDGVTAVDQILEDVCAGEPLGLSLVRGARECRAAVTEADVAASCDAEITRHGCTVSGAFHVELKRDGDTVTGSGGWDVLPWAGCGPEIKDDGRRFTVTATRLGPPVSGRCARPQGLVQTLAAQPGVLALSVVPFAALAADLRVERKAFALEGTFDLGAGSDGIDPRREEALLELGNVRLTVPRGSFRVKGRRTRPPSVAFEGTIGDVRLAITLVPAGEGRYEFRAAGEGARIPGRADVVPFALAIGGDGGVIAVRPRKLPLTSSIHGKSER